MITKDFKKMNALVWDGSGGCIEHAVRLCKDFHEVYYYTVWEESTSFAAYSLGMGMAPNIRSVYDFFDTINSHEVDLICFFDVGAGGMCHYIRETSGVPVYGAGLGEKLEQQRFETRKLQKELGLRAHKTVRVRGTEALRKYLQENPDKYVKLDIFRGDIESFKVPVIEVAEELLREIEHVSGPFRDERPFMIEDCLDAVYEDGLDAFFNGTKFLRPFLVGIEHGIPYIGRSFEVGPPYIEQLVECITPELAERNYRGAISIEQRVQSPTTAYPIDWTCRFPMPLGTIYTNWIKNYSEVIMGCARGEDVKIEPASKYVMGANILAPHKDKAWVRLDIDKAVREKVKLWGACKADGYYHLCKGMDGGVYLVVCGDNLEKMREDIWKLTESVKGYELDYSPVGEIDNIMEDIKKMREMGVDF